VSKTRPALWILVPISLALTVSSIWATFNFGPIGKPSRAALECAELREFVIQEEVEGRSEWGKYRDLVTQFDGLAENSNQRPALVESMAMSIVEVLGHDLTIYKEMSRFPSCIKMERREQLPNIISETESAINFLNGSEDINGDFFDPNLGTWNTGYYSEFISALDYLKGETSATAGA